MIPNAIIDYTESLDELLGNPESNNPAAKQAPAADSDRSIPLRDVTAQAELCNKILGSPIFARMPALVLALQNGHAGQFDRNRIGYAAFEQLAGDCDLDAKRKLLAVLALGMFAGFEFAAARVTGADANLRQIVNRAKLVGPP